MAILRVVKYGDKVLRTPTKEVVKFSSKIRKLVDDLLDTMYAQNGVGLAAPQVGESYRICVIDTSTGNEPLNPIVLINPKIVKRSGAIISREGCLSFPDAFIEVKRYKDIVVRAKDMRGKPFTIEATGGSLLARAIQHECDHLDGVLFIDHSVDVSQAETELEQKGLPAVDTKYLLDESELEKIIAEEQQSVPAEE